MPMDKPKEALSMISRFLSGHSFADRVLPAAGTGSSIVSYKLLFLLQFCLYIVFFVLAVEYEGVALPGVAKESSFETHGEQGGHIGLFLLLVAAVGKWRFLISAFPLTKSIHSIFICLICVFRYAYVFI